MTESSEFITELSEFIEESSEPIKSFDVNKEMVLGMSKALYFFVTAI